MDKANWTCANYRKLMKATGLKVSWSTERLGQEFKAAMKAMPDGTPEYLTADYAKAALAFYEINDAMLKPIVEQQKIIASSPEMTQLSWVMHYCMYLSPNYHFESWGMDVPKLADGTEVKGFGTVMLLSGLHYSEKAWQKLPAEQIKMERGQLSWTIDINPDTGKPKWVSMGLMGWNTLYVKGLIMDVGRLTFEMNSMEFGVKAFRNKKTGQYMLLAEGENRFCNDGWEPDYDEDGEDAIETVFQETKKEYRGNLITKAGQVCRIFMTLPKSEWELVLEDGDPVLSVHISSKGRLDTEAAEDSYARARGYFKEVYPDFEPKAFICDSWLLGHELPRFLKTTSNIYQFASRYYCVPRENNNTDVLNFLFKAEPDGDLKTLPEESSLQKGIKEFMIAGGIMGAGCGIRFFE